MHPSSNPLSSNAGGGLFEDTTPGTDAPAAVAARRPGIRPVGSRAILVELSGMAEVLAYKAALTAHPLPGQVDVLAAAETVLITADSAAAVKSMADRIQHLDLAGATALDDTLRVIDTVYDGEDLDAVSELTGLSRDGVIEAHTAQLWTAAFGGFAPGFAYLVGEDQRLDVPRRQSPRTAVSAGSVGLAGNFSAVYPRQSPGGWQLIGRTAAVMWDLDRAQPALVAPGNRVRYKAVRDMVEIHPSGAGGINDSNSASSAISADNAINAINAIRVDGTGTDAPGTDGTGTDAPGTDGTGTDGTGTDGTGTDGTGVAEPATQRSGMRIISAGVQSLIQDLGRSGYADLGVSVAGALDSGAMRRANRIAGNDPGAAVIEHALDGLIIEAKGDQVLAVTGATSVLSIRGACIADRQVHAGAPFALLDGERLSVGSPIRGLRSYLAFRGGIDVPQVLGSRSTDTMSGIGPKPLAAQSFVPITTAPPNSVVGHPEISGPVGGQTASGRSDPPNDGELVDESDISACIETVQLNIVLGPRQDWFAQEAIESLCAQEWEVTAKFSRVGIRLDGTPLERSRQGELPSEGTVNGSIQVPPSGLPVLFLADHPITGGYPVIGVVAHEHLDRAAQIPPGGRIHFIADMTADVDTSPDT